MKKYIIGVILTLFAGAFASQAHAFDFYMGGTISEPTEYKDLILYGPMVVESSVTADALTIINQQSLTIKEGGSVFVNGTITHTGSVSIVSDGIISAKSLNIGSGSTLVSNGELSTEMFKVSDKAKSIAISENSKFEELSIISSNANLAVGDIFDLNSIFGDTTTIVLSIIENENVDFYITQNYGKETEEVFKLTITESRSVIVGEIPEPSTYAMIFGALALAFAAYRRRK